MKKIAILAATILAMPTALHAEDTLPASRPQVSADVAFPEMTRATRPQGVFVPARHIAMIAPGMKKSEIYTLLDVPHFSEGLFGVRRWNYILNFYTGRADEFRQCQYQIRYDKHYRVEGTYWRDVECSALFDAALAQPKAAERIVTQYVPSPAHTPAAVTEEKAIKTFGFTFDFDKSTIRPAGHDVIRAIVAEVQRGSYRRIVVTGFTDTMGAQGYNDVLAARRAAATVAELTEALAAAGSPLAHQVYSRGGRELAVDTSAQVREEANRRVVIELY